MRAVEAAEAPEAAARGARPLAGFATVGGG